MPSRVPLTIPRDGPFRLAFTLRQGDQPFPLDGRRPVIVIKASTQGPVLDTIDTDDERLYLDETESRVTLVLTEEQTAELPWVYAVYSVSLDGPGPADRLPLFAGSMTVETFG
jgi:hypothetical protein